MEIIKNAGLIEKPYTDEASMTTTMIGFNPEMVELAESFQKTINDEELEGGIEGFKYSRSTPVMVADNKKSLKFIVNKASSRLGSETGENLYRVTIEKIEK